MTEMLTPPEVAAELRRPVGTLAQWRHRNVGPGYVRAGGRILYRRTEVDRWLRQQERATEPSGSLG